MVVLPCTGLVAKPLGEQGVETEAHRDRAKILAKGLAENPNLCRGFPQRKPKAAGHFLALGRGSSKLPEWKLLNFIEEEMARSCLRQSLLWPVLEAPCALSRDCLRITYFKDMKGYQFGVATMNTEKMKQLSSLPGLLEDPSVAYCRLMNSRC
ncbi:hypothetical protein QYF61_010459 [Mycteria americana]|uniref:Uncharacterized protein n=1 Tax=Mycteria americana TaxID=33587 RepID=A0AAN7NI16_MYCAM|nr:hypothetical protein QYF61_010459 [Mycteria americana]